MTLFLLFGALFFLNVQISRLQDSNLNSVLSSFLNFIGKDHIKQSYFKNVTQRPLL